jgi:hypothetical protein
LVGSHPPGDIGKGRPHGHRQRHVAHEVSDQFAENGDSVFHRFSAFCLIFRGRLPARRRDESRSCEVVFQGYGKQNVNDFRTRDNVHCPSKITNVE